jgi:hypothetical protein
MKLVPRLTSVVMLAMVAPSLVLAQAPDKLSPELTQTIKKEVTAALHTYYDYYNAQNMKAMAESVYHIPFVGVGANGFRVQSTKEEVSAAHEAHLKNLIDSGWVRSEFPNPSVCVLNENMASASGQFKRYKKDGSVLSVNANTYFFGKTSDGWKIFSFTNHSLDKVVTCDD